MGSTIALFVRSNWQILVGLAGCAVLASLLVFEKLDHSRSLVDLASTKGQLAASEIQYSEAEAGRQLLKGELDRVRASLVASQERAREAQALAGIAIQRGNLRTQDLQSELDRLRNATPEDPALDCPSAEALGREIWRE